MILSERKLNEIAAIALLVFGCPCGRTRRQIDGFEKTEPEMRRALWLALSTWHFKHCFVQPALEKRAEQHPPVVPPWMRSVFGLPPKIGEQ